MKEVQSPEEIPQFRSEAEEAEFWAAHSLGDWFFEDAEPVSENILPPARPQASLLSELLDDAILARLKEVAYRRGAEPLILVTEFVADRLRYEEESEGILPAGPESNESAPKGSAETRPQAKPRDWQSWAFSFVKENEVLLSDPDIDSITLSRLAKDASDRLLELSGEIRRSSTKNGFPATQMRRMIKGYERLKTLTERAITLYERKFGSVEPGEDRPDDANKDVQRESTGEVEDVPQEQMATVTALRNNLESADDNVIDARERFGA